MCKIKREFIHRKFVRIKCSVAASPRSERIIIIGPQLPTPVYRPPEKSLQVQRFLERFPSDDIAYTQRTSTETINRRSENRLKTSRRTGGEGAMRAGNARPSRAFAVKILVDPTDYVRVG